jgi:hypothetical protein
MIVDKYKNKVDKYVIYIMCGKAGLTSAGTQGIPSWQVQTG